MNNDLQSYFELKKQIGWVFWGLLAAVLVGAISLGVVFFPSITLSPLSFEKVNLFASSSNPQQLNFGLFLEDKNEIPFPDIESNIELVSISDRPGPQAEKTLYLLSIKGRSQKRATNLGQRVYLGFKGKEALKFDNIPSPIWIRIEKGPQLEIGLDLMSEEGEKLIETRRNVKLVLHEILPKVHEIEDRALASFANSLLKLKAYLPDQLYEIYGDGDFLKGKFRLKDEESGALFFIEEGDCFILKEGGWRCEIDNTLPIAKILKIEPSSIVFKIWDRTGLEKCLIHLPIEVGLKIETNPEETFKRLRKRTANTVSCLMGSKKAQLKIGDWAIHTKLGWKLIRSQTELMECIKQKIPAELFVFDGVKKEGGRYYFQGSLFDKTRSEVLPVCLPIVEGKSKALKEGSPTLHAKQIESLDAADFLDSGDGAVPDPLLDFDYLDFDF
jgi:hypothetical protein